MRNILITGGAGFIGSNLVDKLFAEGGWKIAVVDDLNDFYSPETKRRNIAAHLGNENFKCHKFRSMVSDHSKKHDDHKRAVEHAEKGILHKDKNDSRVTWIGKLIRKTSIDELPQLFNVLSGDMSIVGPRPLVPFMLKPFPEFKEIRGLVRPGITGLWQIRDREHNTSAEFMIEHDTEYIQDYSFFLDMKILFETPLVVLSGKGAY